MYIDIDKNLHCIMCGKVIHLEIRRSYDSRRGKIRDNKKKSRGTDMGWDSELGVTNLRDKRTSHNDSTLSRQGSLGSRRTFPSTRK